MIHVISNVGYPSPSRNASLKNCVWQSFDGLSYTCKIGNFVYDWVVEATASSKVFLAVQSPTPTFSYKSYAARECKYSSVYFGSGEIIQEPSPDAGKKDESKLPPPPTDYPDPCLFNANWQGVDGSMISWISNENNTGVSSSTFVMVGGQFYDLGKPILGAALNQEFILAIHCANGVAVFCEYSKKDGIIKKNYEKNISAILPVDADEIERLNGVINEINNKEQPPNVTSKLDAYNARVTANQNELAAAYKQTWSSALDPYNYVGTRNGADILSEEYEKAFMEENKCSSYLYTNKKKGMVFIENNRIAGIKSHYCIDNYRASISPDLTTMLVHIGCDGVTKVQRNRFNFNRATNRSACFGFATFSIATTWQNEQEYKAAEKNGTKLPDKKFTYKITHKKSKYFDLCSMFFWTGADEKGADGEYAGAGTTIISHGGHYTTGYIPDEKAVMRGKLATENAFIFAELVGNKPVWLSAEIDSEMVSGFTYGMYWSTGDTLNWKEVV